MATMASSLQGHVPDLTTPVQLTDTDHLMPAYMAGGTLSAFLNPSSTSNVRSPMGFDGLIEAQMSRPMVHTSATALLQEAEQVGGGGIAHGMMQNSGLGSVMAGPDRATGTRPCIPFNAHELSYQMVGVGGARSGDQFWDADGSLKHTVDFLGVGGERRLQLQQQFGGVGHGERIESLHPLQQPMGHGGSRAEEPVWED